jgi:membrane-associated phospholipid phosphatase
MAAVISHETGSRWVPWVGYPLAGLVGWSRVHDNEHWTSDVVAGAALGAWVAVKSDDWLRSRHWPAVAMEPLVIASGRSLDVGFERRF